MQVRCMLLKPDAAAEEGCQHGKSYEAHSETFFDAVQCEGIMASLEGSHRVSFAAVDNGSVTGRLGAAAAQDNDKYINSESDRQQLLIR